MLKSTIKDLFHRNMYSPDCDLRDALLDAVGGGGDRLPVQAGLLREHRGQRAEVARHQGGLDLESIAGLKQRFFVRNETFSNPSAFCTEPIKLVMVVLSSFKV